MGVVVTNHHLSAATVCCVICGVISHFFWPVHGVVMKRVGRGGGHFAEKAMPQVLMCWCVRGVCSVLLAVFLGPCMHAHIVCA